MSVVRPTSDIIHRTTKTYYTIGEGFQYFFALKDTCDDKQITKMIYIVFSKEIPLQARRGPEGSRRLRLPDFKTIGI